MSIFSLDEGDLRMLELRDAVHNFQPDSPIQCYEFIVLFIYNCKNYCISPSGTSMGKLRIFARENIPPNYGHDEIERLLIGFEKIFREYFGMRRNSETVPTDEDEILDNDDANDDYSQESALSQSERLLNFFDADMSGEKYRKRLRQFTVEHVPDGLDQSGVILRFTSYFEGYLHSHHSIGKLHRAISRKVSTVRQTQPYTTHCEEFLVMLGPFKDDEELSALWTHLFCQSLTEPYQEIFQEFTHQVFNQTPVAELRYDSGFRTACALPSMDMIEDCPTSSEEDRRLRNIQNKMTNEIRSDSKRRSIVNVFQNAVPL